jgi:hypothetical protein
VPRLSEEKEFAMSESSAPAARRATPSERALDCAQDHLERLGYRVLARQFWPFSNHDGWWCAPGQRRFWTRCRRAAGKAGGLPNKEIARMLGISYTNVNRHVTEGRAELRDAA